MKRYLVFAGYNYEPAGGMGDFMSDHDALEDALVAAQFQVDHGQNAHGSWETRHQWCQVLDHETGTIQYGFSREYSVKAGGGYDYMTKPIFGGFSVDSEDAHQKSQREVAQ